MSHWNIQNIDEAEEALSQRERLKRVREFLLKNDADEELIEAIDIAVDDIESWVSKDIEAAFHDGTLRSGEA